MALTTNLVGYWKLDESSGNATDSSGNSHTLTNNNTVTYAAGKINNGAVFNGTTNFLSLANGSSLVQGGAMTIAGWAKFTTVGSTWGFRNDSNCDFYLNPFSSTQAEVRYRNSAGTAFTFTSTSTYDTTFRHYAITWDGTTAILYVNGASNNSVAGGGNTFFTSTTTTFTIGKNEGSGGFMNGSTDEVGLWSRALSSAEISSLYNSGAGLSYPFGAVVHNLMTLGVGA
jgi:Concanavalin A-like lectin/glucanases superfamily